MFEEILDKVKTGRPLSTETTAGKIRTYLESLPEGTKVDARKVAKKFNYDLSATSKIIKGTRTPASKSFDLVSVTDRTINKINTFIKDFKKQNKRLPNQIEVELGSKTDPTVLRRLIDSGNVKNVQKTVFDKQRIGIDYILNTEKPTLKGLQKKLKGTGQNANNLLANLYKRSLLAIGNKIEKTSMPRSVFKDYSVDQLTLLKDKIRDVPDFSSYYERDIRDLVSDAYKNKPKKYKIAMEKINDYFKLNNAIKERFPNLGLQLDHPISYKFLTDVKKETNPENLIRVRPIPGRVNTFKVGLDNRIREVAEGLQKEPGSKQLLNEYSAIQKIGRDLGVDIGKISRGGKFLSYGASKIGDVPLLPDIYKSVDIQNKFTKLIENYGKEDPKIKKLFKDAGININALANMSKTGKINPKTFSNFMNKYLIQNPAARKLMVPALVATGAYNFVFNPTESFADTTDQVSQKGINTADVLGSTAVGSLAAKPVRQKAIQGAKFLGKGAVKILPPAFAYIAAADIGTKLQEGYTFPEALEYGLIGTDIIGGIKKQSMLTPKEREARQVLSAPQIESLDEIGGMGYIQGPSTMSRQEAEGIMGPGLKRVEQQLEEQRAQRRAEVAKRAEGLGSLEDIYGYGP